MSVGVVPPVVPPLVPVVPPPVVPVPPPLVPVPLVPVPVELPVPVPEVDPPELPLPDNPFEPDRTAAQLAITNATAITKSERRTRTRMNRLSTAGLPLSSFG